MTVGATVIDPRRYGATGGANDTTAFVAALAAVPSEGTLLIPPGTWYVDPGTLTMPAGTTIRGEGRSSILRARAGTGALITAGSGTRIEHCQLLGTDTTNGDGVVYGTGIAGSGIGSRSSMDHVRLASFDNNIQIEYAWIIHLYFVELVAAKSNGLFITGPSSNAVNCYGGMIEACNVGVTIDCTTGSNLQTGFFGTCIEGNEYGGMVVTGSTHGARSVLISGCYFESNQQLDSSNTLAADISITGTASVTIRDSYFAGTHCCINAAGGQSPIIDGNELNGASHALYLGAACYLPVVRDNWYSTGGITDDTATGISPQTAADLITGGGFETDSNADGLADNWTQTFGNPGTGKVLSLDAGQAQTGSFAQKIETGTWDRLRIYQQITCTANLPHIARIKYRCNAGTNRLRVGSTVGTNEWANALMIADDAWHDMIVQFTPTSATVYVIPYFEGPTIRTVYLDAVSVIPGTRSLS